MNSPRVIRSAATVFVRGLVLEAEIGVNADEQGQPQPLVVDIEAELSGEPWRGFSETVDYDLLAAHARTIAAAGHIGLVETFAWRLAQACLAEPQVRRVTVRVEKPKALAPAMAGVVIVANLMYTSPSRPGDPRESTVVSEIYTPPPAARPISDPRQTALIIYILMLVPIVIPITHIVGLVMAYVSRDTAPDWLKTHYTYQIRTFWIGLLYFCAAVVSCVILVGILLVPAVIVWYIVRCALGLSRLMREEAYPTPESWTV